MKEEIRAWWNYTLGKHWLKTPPILTLFLTNRCNAHCQHCFYWQGKGRKGDELSLAEIEKLSRSLDHLELLLVSGGEPFLRRDLVEIISLFYRNNGLRSVSLITNGLVPATSRTVERIMSSLPGLQVIVPLSLLGEAAVHNRIVGVKDAFVKVQRTFKELLEVKSRFPGLRLRFNLTVFEANYDSAWNLFGRMRELFPGGDETVWNLSLSLLRGDPRDPDLKLPGVDRLKMLFRHKLKTFKGNGSWSAKLLERLVFAAQIKVLTEGKRKLPCEAGRLEGVVYENGGVALCEMLPSVGNLKRHSFKQIWRGRKARSGRKRIVRGECACTHECYFFPSLVAHPLSWIKLVGNLV